MLQEDNCVSKIITVIYKAVTEILKIFLLPLKERRGKSVGNKRIDGLDCLKRVKGALREFRQETLWDGGKRNGVSGLEE